MRQVSTVLLVSTLCATPAAAGVTPREPSSYIKIRGNKLLPDEIYFAVLELGDRAAPDGTTAAVVGGQILRFLRKAGYALARVRVGLEEDAILVQVDEGRLARIVVRGQGSLTSMRVRLKLELPYNIFNAPYLERQLKNLKKELNLPRAEYELVPVVERAGSQYQLSNMPGVAPLAQAVSPFTEMIRPLVESDEVGDQELHIILSRSEWEGDLKFNLGANREDGLLIKTSYALRPLFFDEDRVRIYVDGGIAYFEHADGDAKLNWSIARGGLQYFTPPLAEFRPLLWLHGEIQQRQRLDIDIRRYDWQLSRAALALQRSFGELSYVLVGGGMEQHRLTGVRLAAPGLARPNLLEVRAEAQAEAYFVFDEEALRIDQRHELFLEAQYMGPSNRDQWWRFAWRYQVRWGYGYNDLIARSSGAVMGGDTVFPQDEPVGERHLRGVFGRVYYVERVAGAGVEMRFSVTRDVLKLGAFCDGVVFERNRPQAGGDLLQRINDAALFAISFGGGVHALIGQMFQLNVFAAVGYATDGGQGHGVSVQLKKAF